MEEATAEGSPRRQYSLTQNTEAFSMDVKRSGSQPPAKGPAEYFKGTVRVDPLFDAPDPVRTARAQRRSKELIYASCHRQPPVRKIRATEGPACSADRERRREARKHRRQICFGRHRRSQRRG